MPQATSARHIDRDRPKARPSAAARSGAADKAPVLFRLPIIRLIAAAPPAVVPDVVPPPVMDPPRTHVPEPVVSVSFPSVATSATAAPAAARVAEAASGGVAASGVASPTASPETAARTWWEHWSSGVVLIVLVVALVTASLVALNDAGPTTAEPLAGEPVTAVTDDFDLSNIVIPDIVTPPAAAKTAPVAPAESQVADAASSSATSGLTTSETSGKSSTAADIAASVPGDAAVPSAVASSQLPSAAPELAATAKETTAKDTISKEPAAVAASPVATPTLTLKKEPVAGPVAESVAKAAAEPKASPESAAPLASLALPVGVTPPPLFAAHPAPPTADAKATEASNRTISGATTSAALPAQAQPELQPGPGSEPRGASPTFYDGAQVSSELHMAQQSEAAPASDVPIDTNQPSFAAILASASRPVADAGTATATPAGAATPAATTDRYGRSQIVTTATPELDTQAIINAYLPYSQAHRAGSGATVNRFGGAGQPSTTTAPAGAVDAASGRGFTLGTTPAN